MGARDGLGDWSYPAGDCFSASISLSRCRSLGGPSLQPRCNVLEDRTPTLEELGITKNQSSEWQRLSQVPWELFERALATQHMPATISIIAAHEPLRPSHVTPVDDDALWLWGTLASDRHDARRRRLTVATIKPSTR
jgi:hypothetical protein